MSQDRVKQDIKETLIMPTLSPGERRSILIEELFERGLMQVNADEPLASLLKTYFIGSDPVDIYELAYNLHKTTTISIEYFLGTL